MIRAAECALEDAQRDRGRTRAARPTGTVAMTIRLPTAVMRTRFYCRVFAKRHRRRHALEKEANAQATNVVINRPA